MKKTFMLLCICLLFCSQSAFAIDRTEGVNLNLNLDDLWVLVAAALVFFMQAGFKVLETGLVKPEHRSGIGAKNLLDWVAGSIAFFLVGFAIMFGVSDNDIIGTSLFAGDGLITGKSLIFFLFQLAFAGTALTIVSGAMSGRTGIIPYFIASLMTAMVIYPVFGHWAWGNLWNVSNTPWLASLGFMDFAGSTVVHSTGAWVAVVGIYMVGPRIGRYDIKGRLQPMKASDYSYSILGVMILWLGWWGFNGGSTLAFNKDVPQIILNTNLAGAAACFAAFFHAYFFQSKKDIIEKIAGGSLTGLVSITACCNVVSPLSSLMIGLIAGILHNLFYVIISKKWQLDDPVGAIAVHGIGGIFGTLCVAIFGDADLLVHDRFTQLGVQVLGIVTCFVFTTSTSYLMFLAIKKTVGIRVSPEHEQSGSFIGEQSEEPSSLSLENKVSQVSVRVSEKGYNLYSITEYLKIDKIKRDQLIKQERITYMDDLGSVVPSLIAIGQLSSVIESQKKEIEVEHDQFMKKQNELDENLSHASKVQNAILGEQNVLKELFPSSFMMFKPKSEVSGDFYWIKKIGTYKIILISNSNHSGVSGGFLSMLGLSLIKEIFSDNKLKYPHKVLELLDTKFTEAIRAKSDNGKLLDTLDVSLVIVDEIKQKLHFSGARNDLYFFQNSQVNEYKGDPCSIGLKDLSDVESFTCKTIDYIQGNSLYLFTNGFANQYNAGGARYTQSKLLKLINEIYTFDFDAQHSILKDEFKEWANGVDQTDDVILLGVELQ